MMENITINFSVVIIDLFWSNKNIGIKNKSIDFLEIALVTFRIQNQAETVSTFARILISNLKQL